jgi:heat shock protein HslJ
MKIFLALMIASFLLTIGCSSNKESVNTLLHDIWVLESIEGKTYSRVENQDLHPTIEIYLAEERFNGNTGCNNMNGKVTMNGNEISFSNIVTTKMFCDGVDETSFISALEKANNYKIEKMRLYLYENEKEILVFKKID